MPSHNLLTGTDLHEPKGADTAALNQVYVANGSGSGAWRAGSPHGGFYFTDFASPFILAATASYRLVNPVTTGTHILGFATVNGRLTYNGTGKIQANLRWEFSFDQSSGGSEDIELAVFKNGVLETGAETRSTTPPATVNSVSLLWDTQAVTNDFFEVYAKITLATNIRFYHMYGSAFGVPG